MPGQAPNPVSPPKAWSQPHRAGRPLTAGSSDSAPSVDAPPSDGSTAFEARPSSVGSVRVLWKSGPSLPVVPTRRMTDLWSCGRHGRIAGQPWAEEAWRGRSTKSPDRWPVALTRLGDVVRRLVLRLHPQAWLTGDDRTDLRRGRYVCAHFLREVGRDHGSLKPQTPQSKSVPGRNTS
jgi:hypothetical protein